MLGNFSAEKVCWRWLLTVLEPLCRIPRERGGRFYLLGGSTGDAGDPASSSKIAAGGAAAQGAHLQAPGSAAAEWRCLGQRPGGRRVTGRLGADVTTPSATATALQ